MDPQFEQFPVISDPVERSAEGRLWTYTKPGRHEVWSRCCPKGALSSIRP